MIAAANLWRHQTRPSANRLSTRSVLGLVLFGLVVFRGAVVGQEKSKPDLGSPGEEHKKLDVLAGDWEVTVRFPVAPGKFATGKSSCEAKWVMDGRFLRQEYSSTFAGKPLTVVRFLGFDRHKGKFTEVHFESTHTDVMHNEGDISKDGTTLPCSGGTHIDAISGKRMNVRSVTSILDKDSFTLELSLTDPATQETKAIKLTHKRKTKLSAPADSGD